ncbi:MAG: cytochrome c biogenesis CcdA family protein [Acidimicrobiia bacterium]|nr:cytochrome c biogenesis CcdA family protein [Acidimicrobiia bacterium]
MTNRTDEQHDNGSATATLLRPQPIPEPIRKTRKQVVIFAVVLALLTAASLIVLLTMTGGEEIDVTEEDVTLLSQVEVTDALVRNMVGPDALELEMLYTPRWYYAWSGRPEPVTDGTEQLGFFMFEITHADELPASAPTINLVTPSGSYAPMLIDPVSDAPHHRVSQLFFAANDSDGEPIITDGDPMVVRATWFDGTVTEIDYQPPMIFGLAALNSTTDTSTGFTFRSPALSMGAIAAIFGGMLAALTPCLLLLAAYYTAVLSSTAAATADKAAAERRLLLTGLFFVGGFTAVYTAGGVVAGYIGESVSRFDSIDGWARPVSVIAGVAVVAMGIRMASQARVPVVCKLPGFNRPTSTGWVGSAVMGSTFAVGCLSCFSATVLTALLLYAGATGSPLAGGLVMLMFSAGVGLMFLIAAILVARAAPLTTWLTKAQPVIGVVSAVVMIFLGMLMVTYKFHIVTGKLFELWI